VENLINMRYLEMRKILCTFLCALICLTISVSAYAVDFHGLEEKISDENGQENGDTQHTHSYDTLKSDTATCGEPGIATYICSCGEEMQTASAATGLHTYGSKQFVNSDNHKMVCAVCGTESYEAHSWDSGRIVSEASCIQEGEQIFSCSDCGGTYSRKLVKIGHAYDPNISDSSYHVCSVCQSRQSHAWNDGEVTRRPTCKDAGTFVYYCSICRMTLVEPLEKLTIHTYDSACDSDCNVCGTKRTIEHTFSTVWSKNYKGHWHECTKCGEQKDFAKHDPGPDATEKEDQVCLTCKYVVTPKKDHVHSYEKQWSFDEVGHWYECTGCKNEKEYAAHAFDDPCDSACNTCSYERDNCHSYEEKWQISNFEHWKVCILCNEESPREKHIPGSEASDDAAQVCTVCAFEISPKLEHSHQFGQKWFWTEDSHWQQCDCGEQLVPAPHIWDSGREGKGRTLIYTCTECSMEKTVETPTSGFSGILLIFILLALVCIGGIAALIIIFKQKDSKEAQIDLESIDDKLSEDDCF